MSSWNHQIRALGPREQVTGRAPFRRSCCTRGCEAPAVFESSFSYRTGRAGRSTTRRRVLCRSHGERFAQKHAAGLPAEIPVPEDIARLPVGWRARCVMEAPPCS